MKLKTLSGALAIVAVTAGAANAAGANTDAQRKAICDKSTTMTWVDKDKTCVAKNACGNDRFAKDYCNNQFASIRVESAADAKNLVNMFVKKHHKYKECNFINEREDHGNYFVGCATSNDYLEFKFGTAGESNTNAATRDYFQAACSIVYNGTVELGKEKARLAETTCHLNASGDGENASPQNPIHEVMPVESVDPTVTCYGVSELECFGITANARYITTKDINGCESVCIMDQR